MNKIEKHIRRAMIEAVSSAVTATDDKKLARIVHLLLQAADIAATLPAAAENQDEVQP